ncbi:hypothetical protein DH2020_028912 [Rehmannia glutinosa]|uniref:NAB domain-containing protein n=1 Tax=Rehmannia glutinosa TaxID=99300 RepID=A0ABR0VTR7_REHGL
MTKHPRKGSLKSMSNHIDPEKEEQLEWVKIEIENQVKRIIKLTKSINQGDNKERNLKNKAEAIRLIEDFQKQYESLYSLYQDLREEVKKNVGNGDDDSSSTSNSDSESYFSPGVSSEDSDSDNDQEPENTSDFENKLTSSSEVKKISSLHSHSESGDIVLKDLESENTMSQRLAQIKDLEGQVANLKHKISTLRSEKRQLECKSDEAKQMREKISRLEAQILEIESKSKENEVGLKKQSEDNEKKYISRISELVAQGNNMQLELNTLKQQKGELEGRFLHETKKWSSQVDGLMKQVNSLKRELVTVNSQKSELEMELKKKSESLKNETTLKEQSLAKVNESLKAQVNDLESKIHSLSSKKSELEEQVKKITDEAFQSNVENEKLQVKISELQTAIAERDDELSTEQKKLTACQNTLSMKTKSLEEEIGNLKSKMEVLETERNHFQVELETLHKDKERLQLELEKEKEECSLSKSQVEKISKSNFQLQVESKEWYIKTKETYEEEMKDLKCRAERNEIEFKNVKDMTLAANDVLTSLDAVALKFDECSASFLDRVSKASCELKFAKDWAMRKKDDLDRLLAQLDDKEAEILVFREKVWESENKVRELEKMIKEKEDAMLEVNDTPASQSVGQELAMQE